MYVDFIEVFMLNDVLFMERLSRVDTSKGKVHGILQVVGVADALELFWLFVFDW